MITQRKLDLWRVESQERIRKMFEEWQRDYLGNRMDINPGYAARNAAMNREQDGNRRDRRTPQANDY